MRLLLTLLLGLGAAGATACTSMDTSDVQQDNTYTIQVEGMT